MFIVEPQGEILKNSDTYNKICSNCKNQVDFVVWKEPYGPQMGTIFSRSKTLGMKKFYLVCPTCNFVDKELTKEQALNMIKK